MSPTLLVLATLGVAGGPPSLTAVTLADREVIATSADGATASVLPWQISAKNTDKGERYRQAFVLYLQPDGSSIPTTLEFSHFRCAANIIEDRITAEYGSDGLPISEIAFKPPRTRPVAQLNSLRKKVFTAICGMVVGAG